MSPTTTEDTPMTDALNQDWEGFTPDADAWTDDYAEGNQGGGARFMPPRGLYYLAMPAVIGDDCFGLTKDKKGFEILLGTKEHPLSVVSGPLQNQVDAAVGCEIRYVRVNTKRIQNNPETSAGSVLRNFGMTPEEVTALHRIRERDEFVSAWKAAFQALAGQTTPQPVLCDWEGSDKGAPNGTVRYRGMGTGRGKDPRFTQQDEQGNWLPYVDLDRDEPDPKNPGQTRKARVWANFGVAFLGFTRRS